MTDPTDDSPLERRLRRALDARAQDAPDANALTERLLAAGAGTSELAGTRPLRSGWQTWGTPLVAAACVAAIVGIVLAVVRPGHSGHGPDAADSVSPAVPSAATSAPTPKVVLPPSAVTPAASPSGVPVTLQGIQIIDLTFRTSDSGWALASADCLAGPGRCTAVLRTTNGTDWSTFPNSTHFDGSGATAGCPPTKCVTHIRFADAAIGYAFGPQAFFMTVDGGRSWTQQSGGADALETLDGNVIRVTSAHSGCPGPCGVRVETAALGSSSWRSVALPGGTVDAGSVALARTGAHAFLTTSTGQAGSLYDVVLFTSADDGASWSRKADPCSTQVVPSVVTQDLTTAADGSVSVHCAGASGADPSIITSTDGGASFAAPRAVVGAGVVPSAAHGVGLASIAAASRQVLIGYGDGGLYRSVDGGHTWRRVLADSSDGTVTAPGFESATVGRWVSPDGRTIWTTRTAGASWTKVSL